MTEHDRSSETSDPIEHQTAYMIAGIPTPPGQEAVSALDMLSEPPNDAAGKHDKNNAE